MITTSWASTEEIFGASCTSEISRLARLDGGACLPIRLFLMFLSEGRHGSDRTAFVADVVFNRITGRTEDPLLSPRDYASIFTDAVNAWVAAYTAAKLVGETACLRYTSRCAVIIARLSEAGVKGFPAFQLTQMRGRPQYSRGKARLSLSELKWTELLSFPEQDHDQLALALVREAAVEEFKAYDAQHTFGQALLRGDPAPDGADPKARAIILRGLEEIRRGRSRTEVAGQWDADLVRRDFWISAGLSSPPVPSGKRRRSRSAMLLGCLGPTHQAAWAAAWILGCDTGWNVQPILNLPRMPFAFTSGGTRWFGTNHVIQAFKARAGRLVLASLEEELELTGGRLQEAKQIWREVIASEDPGNQQDGYCMLTDGPNSEWPATRVLDRYQAMAETIRKDAPHLDSAFWIFLKGKGGEVGRLGETGDQYRHQLNLQPGSRIFPHNPVLSRDGLNLSCVRKSVLSQRRAQGGSIVAARAPAGHAGQSVLMPHYLNTPAVNAQLDASIRNFQNSLQALIVRDLDQDTVSLRLKTSVSELERLRLIAVSSGIASGAVREVVDF